MQRYRKEYNKEKINLTRFDNYLEILLYNNSVEKVPTDANNILRAVYFPEGVAFLRRLRGKKKDIIEFNVLASTFSKAEKIASDLERELLKD